MKAYQEKCVNGFITVHRTDTGIHDGCGPLCEKVACTRAECGHEPLVEERPLYESKPFTPSRPGKPCHFGEPCGMPDCNHKPSPEQTDHIIADGGKMVGEQTEGWEKDYKTMAFRSCTMEQQIMFIRSLIAQAESRGKAKVVEAVENAVSPDTVEQEEVANVCIEAARNA